MGVSHPGHFFHCFTGYKVTQVTLKFQFWGVYFPADLKGKPKKKGKTVGEIAITTDNPKLQEFMVSYVGYGE